MSCDVTVLLFDLGGVLVDFSGVEDLVPFLPGAPTVDEVRDRWLACPHSQAFGTGGLSSVEFAERFVNDWQISLTPEAFLDVFGSWTRDLLPGAEALLRDLRPHFRLAALSNCNPVHWARLEALGVPALFDVALSSHAIGCRKPEAPAFRAALDRLDVSPEAVIFFDDSASNVAAARALHLRGHVVNGPDDVRRRLAEDGCLPDR